MPVTNLRDSRQRNFSAFGNLNFDVTYTLSLLVGYSYKAHYGKIDGGETVGIRALYLKITWRLFLSQISPGVWFNGAFFSKEQNNQKSLKIERNGGF